MLSVESALKIILDEIGVMGLEKVGILASPGRVLGEDVSSSRDNPAWDNSAMDGYAVRAIDTRGASRDNPVTLRVVEDLPAGYVAKRALVEGETTRIMTGAPIPEGADAVVMVEDTEIQGSRVPGVKGQVKIFKGVKVGENIRRKGEDFKKGDIVLKKGSVIRPAEVCMLAAIGRSFVSVYQRPRVAILPTGDELVEIDETPGEGQIFNTNSYALFVQVKECGAEPVQIGIARDNREDLRGKLTFAATSDCIISSGGVSVGDFDYVKDVLKDMGTKMRFWKVAIKPGKPLAFGVIGGRPAFGLPGNPISSMVAFEQFVRPALLKMMGRSDIFRRTVDAVLMTDLQKKPGRMHFLRARLGIKEGDYYVTPLEGQGPTPAGGKQGSAILSSMVKANSLIILPEDGTTFPKDTRVKVQPLDDGLLFQGEPGY